LKYLVEKAIYLPFMFFITALAIQQG